MRQLLVSTIVSAFFSLSSFGGERIPEKLTETQSKAFWDCLKNNDVATMKKFLTKEPGLANAKSGYFTPLHRASGNNYYQMVELLLNFKADPDAESFFGYTAFEDAVWWRRNKIALLMLDHGATLDIYSAAGLGKIEKVAFFLDENNSCFIPRREPAARLCAGRLREISLLLLRYCFLEGPRWTLGTGTVELRFTTLLVREQWTRLGC